MQRGLAQHRNPALRLFGILHYSQTESLHPSFKLNTLGTMSGIEIAGLVLGAFPVALELLKKYKEIGQEYHFWREIRKEFRKCEQDLRYHRLQFQSNLKLLLLPLAIDKQRIEMVLSEPDSDVWSDQDMAQQLERRLGDSFELYMDTVERMNQTMKEMEAALALNSDSVPTQLTEQNTVRILTTSQHFSLTQTLSGPRMLTVPDPKRPTKVI